MLKYTMLPKWYEFYVIMMYISFRISIYNLSHNFDSSFHITNRTLAGIIGFLCIPAYLTYEFQSWVFECVHQTQALLLT